MAHSGEELMRGLHYLLSFFGIMYYLFIFALLLSDCHTVSLAAGWNGLKTALCMLANTGRETV